MQCKTQGSLAHLVLGHGSVCLHLEFILKGLGMQIQTLSYKVGWLDRLMDNEPVMITTFAVG